MTYDPGGRRRSQVAAQYADTHRLSGFFYDQHATYLPLVTVLPIMGVVDSSVAVSASGLAASDEESGPKGAELPHLTGVRATLARDRVESYATARCLGLVIARTRRPVEKGSSLGPLSAKIVLQARSYCEGPTQLHRIGSCQHSRRRNG